MTTSGILKLKCQRVRKLLFMRITIPSKYYIKVYLENNCGIPVDLSVFPDFHEKFRNSLDKISGPVKIMGKIYDPETVTIIIPSDWFYRYGYHMSIGRVRELNNMVEMRLKYTMRQYITLNVNHGQSVTFSIKAFQDEYCLPETVWPFQSIVKDYARHCLKIKLKPKKLLRVELNNLLLENLSEVGTIPDNFKNERPEVFRTVY